MAVSNVWNSLGLPNDIKALMPNCEHAFLLLHTRVDIPSAASQCWFLPRDAL